MSVTISIRVEDDIRQDIEELGYKPGEYLKKILARELKRERSRRALTWLKDNRIKSKEKSAEELVREDRDSR